MSDTSRGSGPDPGRPEDGLDDQELREVVDDLTRTLQDVQRELERERERERRDRRGLFGLPRPPSGRELLRFADEFAIPAAITVLEANVELLKHLRRAIRAAETTREAGERTREVGEEAVDVGQDLLERVGDGLRDLRSAIEGGSIPEEAGGEDLLGEVRDLQEEVDDRVRRAREAREASDPREARGAREAHDDRRGGEADRGRERRDGTGSRPRSANDGDGADGERRGDRRDDDVEVDVDAELESLRERYREDDAAGADGDDAEDDGDAE